VTAGRTTTETETANGIAPRRKEFTSCALLKLATLKTGFGAMQWGCIHHHWCADKKRMIMPVPNLVNSKAELFIILQW
jgi:hypothetical protein